MNNVKKALLLLGAAIVLLVLFTLARTVRYGTGLSPIEPAVETAIPQGAAERLAGSLRFRTISHDDPAAFDATPREIKAGTVSHQLDETRRIFECQRIKLVLTSSVHDTFRCFK